MSLASVDLPAPVGPTSASRSPSGTHSAMSWSTSSSPYPNDTCSSSSPPSSGRSIAPGRSAIEGGSSRSSNTFWRAAPACCSVLYSWLSCWIGSNRLFRYSTKAATVPTVTMSADTNAPPIPTMRAIPVTPANSTIGKYFAEMRTVSMLASYLASLGSWDPAGECPLPAERLHDADAREPFLQGREVLADPVAHEQVRLVGRPPEPAAGNHDRRHHDQRAQRKLPAHQEDHEDRAHEQQTVLDEHDEAHLDDLLHRVHIRGHAGDELAGFLALEEVHAERHQVSEHTRAEVPQERLTDAGDHLDHGPAEEQARDRRKEIEQRREVECAGVVGA